MVSYQLQCLLIQSSPFPVCVFVRVCALSSPQLVLARYNEGEDDQDVLPDSGKTPKNCPPRSQCAVCGACVDLFTEGQLFIRIVSVPPCWLPPQTAFYRCALKTCVCVFAVFASRLLVVTVLNAECCGRVDESIRIHLPKRPYYNQYRLLGANVLG